MNQKEINQEIYRETRRISNGDTALCLEFLKFMKDENKGIEDLLDMEDLSLAEREYIKQLIEE
jgi:hypothetical protein